MNQQILNKKITITSKMKDRIYFEGDFKTIEDYEVKYDLANTYIKMILKLLTGEWQWHYVDQETKLDSVLEFKNENPIDNIIEYEKEFGVGTPLTIIVEDL